MVRFAISHSRLARLTTLVLGVGAFCSLMPELAANPLYGRPALGTRLRTALFPAPDPGYLPLVGTHALRIADLLPAEAPITTPSIPLYAPPIPAEATPAATGDSTSEGATPVPEESPTPALADRKPPPLRAEDFIPYFQLGSGANPDAEASLRFTPARAELPQSRAEYRQQ